MIKAEKVKISQLALILLIVIPGGKYLSLLSYMYSISGRDSWLSFLLLFVLDFVCFLFTLWAINLNRRGLSLNEILTRTLSPVGAKIIFAVFTVFCLLRVTVLLLGCVDLFSSTFVINTNWLAYIIPIALLVAVSLVQGVRNVARLTEMLFVFVMLALLSIIFLSLRSADFSNLRPFLNEGFKPVLEGSLDGSFWFADSVFLLFFLEKVEAPKKKDNVLLCVMLLIGILVTMALVVLYVALFGNASGINGIAITKVSQFNISNNSYGRLDWLSISIWMCSIFIKIIVLSFCAYSAIVWTVGYKKEKFNWWVFLSMVVPVIALPLFFEMETFIFNQVSKGFVKYILIVVQYVLPICLPFLTKAACAKDGREKKTSGAGRVKGEAV